MVTRDRISLRATADLLDLDPLRLFRLGRYLHLAPGDDCLPYDVVLLAQHEEDGEKRYRMVLESLLGKIRSDMSSSNGHPTQAEQRGYGKP
jgi:hypothetical protein